jgi:hypothetical protein
MSDAGKYPPPLTIPVERRRAVAWLQQQVRWEARLKELERHHHEPEAAEVPSQARAGSKCGAA